MNPVYIRSEDNVIADSLSRVLYACTSRRLPELLSDVSLCCKEGLLNFSMDNLLRKKTLLMKKSVAQSMWQSRKSQWKCYKRFCEKFNLQPLPCTDDQLSLYATLLNDYMCHSSLLVYLQAVVFASKISSVPPPSLSNVSVKIVLEGVSHVTESVHSLKCGDLEPHPWGLMPKVRSSKTHRGGKPLLLPLCKIPDKRFCPVTWINSLLKGRVLAPCDPLFSSVLGRRYTYSMFRSLLDKLCQEAGIKEKFSGHSFRKGGALYLISLGVPLTQVQERGNWKSMCVLRYLSIPVENRISLERVLASQFV